MWSYPLDGKWKTIFHKKIDGYMIFSSNVLKRRSFQKGRAGTWSFFYYLERWYFFPKTWYFFLVRKVRDDLSQEIHEIWYFLCTRAGVTNVMPWLSAKKKKKSKMVLFREKHLKVNDVQDWYSRKSSRSLWKKFSVLSWRPLQAFPCIALQQKKPENLKYRIEVWLLLQFIRLEIFYNE